MNESDFLKRQEELYNTSTRIQKFKNSKLYPPVGSGSPLITPSPFSAHGFLNTLLVPKKNFQSIYNESSSDSLEDSYESLKNFLLGGTKKNKSANSNLNYTIYPHSYTRVIDPFRADYEEIL